jgi:hypothetical protein
MKKPTQPTLEEMRTLIFSAMGRKGGRARAKTLSPARRKAIAEKAAMARWAKKKASS